MLDTLLSVLYNSGMEVEGTAVEVSSTEWLQQVQYWKAMHARAVERETLWKERAVEWERVARQRDEQIQELTAQSEALKARVVWLELQVFGRKSEQGQADLPAEGKDSTPPSEDAPVPAGRKRGQQPGQKGHGRKRRTGLSTQEIVHTLPPDQKKCPRCSRPFRIFPGTEDSDEISWEVVLVRRIHQRVRYQPTCDCGAVPGIVTAPGTAKLIPKGLFSIAFWVRLLLEKFLFQIPLYRVRQKLELEGLWVSQGTLTGGLQTLGELLQPLYARILERSRTAHHWHMDETRWSVFAEVEGKSGYRWWLWVIVTKDTVAYILDPTRSGAVPRNHLGKEAQGILNADRYVVYKTLGEKIRIAFCWVHVRRDFIEIRNGYPRLRNWAQMWVDRINELFGINRQRLQARSQPELFDVHDQALRKALSEMAQERDRQLEDPSLHPASRGALSSLKNHWEGLLLFVDHPEIPMDNNEAERRLRNPVVGRKNYYGSGSVWSGALAACTFTIFQTLLKNGIHPRKFMEAYFEACAQAGGHVPEDLESWLPWNLSTEKRTAWAYQTRSP